MGRATILSGGPAGRYQIEVDVGEAEKGAKVERLTASLADVDAEVVAAQLAVTEANAQAEADRQVTSAAIEAYVLATQLDDEDAIAAALKAYEAAFAVSARSGIIAAQAIAQLQFLQLKRASLAKQLTAANQIQATLTKNVWCTDLTENATGSVATLEIPGEENLILIQPRASTPTANDGRLLARDVMSPEQAYFNVAILPGWQRWMPMYRTGHIISLDQVADRAWVNLDEAKSSAQNLDVNIPPSLANIPVAYMTCNAEAFEVGDHVVVAFTGYNWSVSRVIGFVTDPQPCPTCEGTTTFISVSGISWAPESHPLYFPMPFTSGVVSEIIDCGEPSSVLEYGLSAVDAGATFTLPAGDFYTTTDAFGIAQMAIQWFVSFGTELGQNVEGGGNITVNRAPARYTTRRGIVCVYGATPTGNTFLNRIVTLDLERPAELPGVLFEAVGGYDTEQFVGETVTVDHAVYSGLVSQWARLTYQESGPISGGPPEYRVLRLISCVPLSGVPPAPPGAPI